MKSDITAGERRGLMALCVILVIAAMALAVREHGVAVDYELSETAVTTGRTVSDSVSSRMDDSVKVAPRKSRGRKPKTVPKTPPQRRDPLGDRVN